MNAMRQDAARSARDGEELLFLRRWLANPGKVGAVLPSSAALGRLVARNVARRPDQWVVELGAGTGTVTRVLLESGIPADRLVVVEIDPDLGAFRRRELPRARVVQGDATELRALLPGGAAGNVGTVVSGIPMLTLPPELQRRMVGSWLDVMPPDGRLLQYTYSLASPLPAARLGLAGRRCGLVMRNLPPAWVWSYRRAG